MYDFWDYFWGWVLLIAWVVPLLVALALKILFTVIGVIGAARGFPVPQQTGTRVRFNSNDYDEDGY